MVAPTPSFVPTVAPSTNPVKAVPSAKPTRSILDIVDTARPTPRPTTKPTPAPSASPTASRTVPPSYRPTLSPTRAILDVIAPPPSSKPTASTVAPTAQPTLLPSVGGNKGGIIASAPPSRTPSATPTRRPTWTTAPSVPNATSVPTACPSAQPTNAPAVPTPEPTTSWRVPVRVIAQLAFTAPDDETAFLDHKDRFEAAVDDTFRLHEKDGHSNVRSATPLEVEARRRLDDTGKNANPTIPGKSARNDQNATAIRYVTVVKFECIFQAYVHYADMKGQALLSEIDHRVEDNFFQKALRNNGVDTDLELAEVDKEVSFLLLENATVIVGVGFPEDDDAVDHPPLVVPPPHLPDDDEDDDSSKGKIQGMILYAVYATGLLITLMTFCWCKAFAKLKRRQQQQQQVDPEGGPGSPTTRDVDLQLADAIDLHFQQLAALGGAGSLSRQRFDFGAPGVEKPEPLETFRVRARTRRLRWDDDGRGHVSWTGTDRFIRKRTPEKRRRKSDDCCWVADEKSERPSLDSSTSSDSEDDSSWKKRPLEFVPADAGLGLSAAEELRKALDKSPDLDFPERMEAFRTAMDSLRVHWTVGRVEFTVRRDAVLNDAFDAICDLPAEHWRRPFFISFEGECALDAGGLSREFFELVSVEAFHENFGCFLDCHGGSYQVNNDDASNAVFGDSRPWLAFVGRLLGKAILEGHHIAAHPCKILLKHMCGEPIELDDLQYVDFELWKNLMALLTMPSDVLESLDLTFALERRRLGDGKTFVTVEELIPNGASTIVTPKNVGEYLKLRLKERVLDVCARGLDAFLEGLYSVVPFEALLLLSARELELTLCGIPVIPVDDWKKSTMYAGGFAALGEQHPVVQFFWDVVGKWDNQRRARLLQWCTGSSKVPVQGFDHLQGRDGVTRKFTLTSIDLSQAIYPRAHTCFNRIDLPLYTTKADLRKALDFVLTNAVANEVFSIE